MACSSVDGAKRQIRHSGIGFGVKVIWRQGHNVLLFMDNDSLIASEFEIKKVKAYIHAVYSLCSVLKKTVGKAACG